MGKLLDRIFGKKVNGVHVVPLSLKIISIFIVLLLTSNLVSNYINLMLNRGELLKLMNQLLVKDLKELHVFSTNQYEIYQYNQDLESSVESIEQNALGGLTGDKSLALGINSTGDVFFSSSKSAELAKQPFTDTGALNAIIDEHESGQLEGTISFKINGDNYFGVYKYNSRWEQYLIRAEEKNEFYHQSTVIFILVSALIILITIICAILGIILIKKILHYVKIITHGVMDMHKSNKMESIDLSDAPNDEVTYLGTALNATSSTIDALMSVFKKFVARDVAEQAYKEKDIRLEGYKRELTILFTDIKSFTNMTEALGNDIIKLLNIHYEKAIHHIHDQNGIIGSIIGDALLAVFGTLKGSGNKSYEAIVAAYEIQEVANKLRKEMHKRREEITKVRGNLNKDEEKIYKAVLLEVGVGIDGGEVFYGNIGSSNRMTNTVIGDNVNSSSRLEGLTRVYKVPVIDSSFIK